jgi:hypothetical protein
VSRWLWVASNMGFREDSEGDVMDFGVVGARIFNCTPFI